MNSLNQSLKRMNLDYVDIFYSHRYDPETPLEETLQALVDIVRQGKALYVGISKYPKEAAEFAYRYLAERDVHCLLEQAVHIPLRQIAVCEFGCFFRVFGNTHIQGLTLAHDVHKRLQCFFEWSFRIVTVRIEDVYIIQIHPFQALIKTVHQIFPGTPFTLPIPSGMATA